MGMDFEDDIVQDFLVESREILESLSEQLVDLEQRPDDRELLNSVFRGFHTIKGGAGFLNLDALVEVCHRTEDLFNLLRQGDKSVSPELMDVVLQALDVVQSQFSEMESGAEPSPASPELLAALEALNVPDGAEPVPPEVIVDAATTEEDPADAAFDQLLGEQLPTGEPLPSGSGSDEITEDEFEALLDALHGKGQHSGAPKQTAPAAAESALAGAEQGAAGAGDDLISEDEFEALLDNLHGNGKAPGAEAPAAKPAAAQPAAKKAAAPAPTPADAAKPAAKAADKAAAKRDGETTVRVDTAKLDDIMNLVGELVLVRNRLSTLRGLLNDERMNQAVGDLELVTSDLQTAVMKTRMQPIKKVFGRFPRLVRDLARSLKKEVELELRGEDTDLDKNLVEALADPLIHLVRNAVDHGIEEPDARERAGKRRAGKVLLAAEQEGDHILLTIADDGKGMDAEMLRRKVVEKGLMDAESAARLDEHDCYNLIFMPGFSTKTDISDVSGRGVGMDVVKTSISRLNGTVEIDSKPGAGTTMRIKVPLTLAILPTLMVKVQGRKFALPMSVVREIFELDAKQTKVVDGRLVVMVRNKAMPLFFLDRWLSNQGGPVVRSRHLVDDGVERQVVTVVLGNQAIGFVVEEVFGLEEVVIKPLGAMLQGLPGLAGSTITGDGKIALIVDIPSLVKAFGSKM